jgi:hypothetical protein
MALCLMGFGFPFVLMLSSGHLGVAAGIGAAWWGVQWGLPRAVRWLIWQLQDGARWAGRWSLGKLCRWWQGLVVLLVLGSLVAGCADVSRGVLKLTGCEDEAIDAGYCHMPKERKP